MFRDDLKGFFDVQISKLFDMLDKQLTRIEQKQPGEQIVSHALTYLKHLPLTFNLAGSPRSLWGTRKFSLCAKLFTQPLRLRKHLTHQRAKHADPHCARPTACRV